MYGFDTAGCATFPVHGRLLYLDLQTGWPLTPSPLPALPALPHSRSTSSSHCCVVTVPSSTGQPVARLHSPRLHPPVVLHLGWWWLSRPCLSPAPSFASWHLGSLNFPRRHAPCPLLLGFSVAALATSGIPCRGRLVLSRLPCSCARRFQASFCRLFCRGQNEDLLAARCALRCKTAAFG